MAVQVELSGVRLFGPLPLGSTELFISPGLTSIGGVNGAGKSTILRGVGEALSGRLEHIDGADLVFSLRDGSDGTVVDPNALKWISQLTRYDRRDQQPEGDVSAYDSLRAHLRRESSALLDRGTQRFSDSRLQSYEDLLTEVCDQGYVCYSLRRLEQSVRGALFFAGAMSSSTPVLADLLDEQAMPDDSSASKSNSRRDERWFPAAAAQMPMQLSLLSAAAHSGSLPIPVVPITRAQPAITSGPGPRGKRVPRSQIEGLMTVERLEPVSDPDRATTVRLAELDADLGEERGRGRRPDEILGLADEWAAALSESATSTWHELRPDQAQELTCRVSGNASDWSDGRFFAWETRDSRSSEMHPMSQLSGGQLRWAGLSVAFALSDQSLWAQESRPRGRPFDGPDAAQRPSSQHWWLLDEPELGIHRNVEHLVGADLRDIAQRKGLYVVAATHSSAIMAASDEVLATSRTENGIQIRPVGGVPAQLRELGLDPMDAMGWYQAFLLVEGRHDMAVIDAFMGDELFSRRVKMYCLGGSTNLPATVQSQFLAEIPNAAVIAVLDNIDTDEARRVWFDAKKKYLEEDFASAKAYLDAESKGRGTEWKGMKGFYLEALGKDFQDRLSVIGLPQSDVLRYLPPRTFDRDMPETWDDVAETYSKETGENVDPATWAPKKQWVERKFGFSFAERIDEAAAAAAESEPKHMDFELLLAGIETAILDSQSGERGVRIP